MSQRLSEQAKWDLPAWLSYYETLHAVGIDMGLTRVSAVWKTLCQTYHIDRLAKQKTITVSGTNGKGSSCQMLSMLLQAQGYQVGLYTSPHIHRFNERIKLSGKEVGDAKIIQAFQAIEEARGDVTLSYFEATTLAGLLIFAWAQPDYVVLEVGLGGRLDAINIIDADAVVITSVGLDHEAFLGNDVEKTALEKAGICRPHCPAVYAQQEVFPQLLDYANAQHIPLICRERDYTIETDTIQFNGHSYQLPLAIIQLGTHQVSNAAAVIVLLSQLSVLPADYAEILSRFSVAGRLQKIAEKPDIILDVAHNEDAAVALAEYIVRQKPDYKQNIAVIGMLKDKNHAAVLAAFRGVFDSIYIGSTEGERGFSGDELAAIAKQTLSVPVNVFSDLPAALSAAQQVAGDEDAIYAFGSFLVVEALS